MYIYHINSQSHSPSPDPLRAVLAAEVTGSKFSADQMQLLKLVSGGLREGEGTKVAEEREVEEGGGEVRDGGGNDVAVLKTHLEAMTFESSTGIYMNVTNIVM